DRRRVEFNGHRQTQGWKGGEAELQNSRKTLAEGPQNNCKRIGKSARNDLYSSQLQGYGK
ncbi:MAG: hypothetical protein KDB14_09895, partial [Planctomycetales bacterium]|nr:hypothetical protein [Planctomycetales bacterium]